MILARSGLRLIAAIRCASMLGIFIAVSTAAFPASRWDREGARLALTKAQTLQTDLSSTQEPSKSQYLSCIKQYRLVYLKDPHFNGSDDAIYASGLLYEEMGNRFNESDYFRKAVTLFKFLVSDYSTSSFCSDALLHLANLYSAQLVDNNAAQQSYQLLRTRYPNSKAALSAANSINATPAPSLQPAESQANSDKVKAKSASPVGSPAKSSLIQGIRYWTANEYTRVIIDMDAETHYNKAQLSNPDRVYFDISNANLSPDLLGKTFEIGDEFVKRVRLAKNRADIVRVVLDLEAIKNYSVSELKNPFRIVVDIHSIRSVQASAERLLGESKPRPDEEFLERSKNKSESAQKPVMQQQARNVPKEPAILPSPQPASSLKTSAPKSETRVVAAAEKETAANIPAEAAQMSVHTKANALSEAKAPAMSTGVSTATPMSSAAVESGADKASSSGQMSGKIEAKPPLDAKMDNAGKPESTLKSAPAAKTTDVAEATVSKPADVPPAVKPADIPSPKVALPTSRGDRTLTRALGLKVARIVIDPGHGGRDTGTIGRGGLMEKNLTLELAKTLRQMLERGLGLDVVLTREEDVFLSLEERTAIANKHQADLFVSIHANSSPARSTSGVETYFLDFARNSAAREIAARENATSMGNVRDLEELIKRIAQADKSAESRELAAIVQKTLFNGARKLLPSTHNRGVRSAPFVVLIGANMPSVLAEVAFISNPRDESMLKKKESQEQFAKALFAGIESYMKALGANFAQNQTR
jgi:N-acetylmuramoyl-L-alanine amidase